MSLCSTFARLLTQPAGSPLRAPRRLAHSVALIGAPFSRGQRKRGVDHGPAAVRNAGLVGRLSSMGCQVYDFGDLSFTQVPNDELYNNLVKYPRSVGLANQVLADTVNGAVAAGHSCVTIGGDHRSGVEGTLVDLLKSLPEKLQTLVNGWQ